jgi:hypothetical protein
MVNGALTLTVPAGWSAPTTTPGAGLSTASRGTLSVAGRTLTVSGLTLPGNQSMTLTYGSTAGGGPGASAPATAGAPSWPATELSSAGGAFVALVSPPSVAVMVGVLDHFKVEAAAGGPIGHAAGRCSLRDQAHRPGHAQ